MNGNLEKNLEKVALEHISSADLLNINYYALQNKEVISFLYSQKIIDGDSIGSALEQAAFFRARIDYKYMLDTNTYADHVGRPDCLAYALAKGQFTEKEIKKFKFDHGDNAESFQQKYGQDVISHLRNQLLNPVELPKDNEPYDEHPVCPGCGY